MAGAQRFRAVLEKDGRALEWTVVRVLFGVEPTHRGEAAMNGGRDSADARVGRI